jgi:hypothetical protein
VRVRLERVASTGADSVHDYLYEVDRIGKSITGEVQLDLTHFPVDANLASVVAQEVNSATGSGLLLPTGLSGISCVVNSSADTRVPAETFTEGTFPEYGSNISNFGGGSGSGGGNGGFGDGDSTKDNEDDGKDGQAQPAPPQPPTPTDGDPDNPVPGDTLTAPSICEGGRVIWYRVDPSVEGGRVFLGGGPSYTLTINDIDYSVYYEIECPDPSTPTGYGEPIASAPTPTNGFIPTPSTITVNVVSEIYDFSGEKLFCGSGTVANNRSTQLSTASFSVSNVVGYMQLNNVAIDTFVCTGPSVGTVKDFGILLWLANGTTTLVGATRSEGTVFGVGVTGENNTYYQAYLTYGAGIFLYETPAFTPPF